MTHSESCPLCAQDLVSPHQLDICSPCHSSLQRSGAIPVTTTSEFLAVADPRPTASLRNRPRAGTEEIDSPHCCWCKKEPEQVRRVMSQGNYHICNECVYLCADIMRMELGDHFG